MIWINGGPTENGICYVAYIENFKYKGLLVRKVGDIIYEVSKSQFIIEPDEIAFHWAFNCDLPELPEFNHSSPPSKTKAGQV
jgi:hypothetical protein